MYIKAYLKSRYPNNEVGNVTSLFPVKMPPVRDSERGDDKVKGSSLSKRHIAFGKPISHELLKYEINLANKMLKITIYFLCCV